MTDTIVQVYRGRKNFPLLEVGDRITIDTKEWTVIAHGWKGIGAPGERVTVKRHYPDVRGNEGWMPRDLSTTTAYSYGTGENWILERDVAVPTESKLELVLELIQEMADGCPA